VCASSLTLIGTVLYKSPSDISTIHQRPQHLCMLQCLHASQMVRISPKRALLERRVHLCQSRMLGSGTLWLSQPDDWNQDTHLRVACLPRTRAACCLFLSGYRAPLSHVDEGSGQVFALRPLLSSQYLDTGVFAQASWASMQLQLVVRSLPALIILDTMSWRDTGDISACYPSIRKRSLSLRGPAHELGQVVLGIP
jgi:hypothetical protein